MSTFYVVAVYYSIHIKTDNNITKESAEVVWAPDYDASYLSPFGGFSGAANLEEVPGDPELAE